VEASATRTKATLTVPRRRRPIDRLAWLARYSLCLLKKSEKPLHISYQRDVSPLFSDQALALTSLNIISLSTLMSMGLPCSFTLQARI
jgi:hypothetical protein